MKNEHLITSIVSVLLAITGLAIIAVLVSNKANTGSVLSSAGGGFSKMLCTALSPLGLGGCGASVSLPIGTASSTITYG